MNAMLATVRRWPLVTFFVLAYGFAWAAFPLFLVSEQLGFLAFFTPAVAALLTAAAVGGRPQARKLLGSITAWRGNLAWCVVAVGLPILLSLALPVVLSTLAGNAVPWQLEPVSPLVLAVFVLAVGEELGWRGYAQPQLETRHSALAAAIGLGILWGFWHLPIFFIPGLPQADIPLPAFILFTVAFSVLMAWLLRRSGRSVLVAALFHASFNTFSFLTPSLSTAERWWFMAGSYSLTASVVVLFFGRDLIRRNATALGAGVSGRPAAPPSSVIGCLQEGGEPLTANIQSPCQLVLPIRLGIDPMEGLLMFGIAGDPEFESLEPQVFDDAINGKGMRVLRYRRDGRVDVYWQPGVHVDRSSFSIGAGPGDFEEVPITPARFEIGARGVMVDLAFTDAQGRRTSLRVFEDAAGKQGFPMLAPVGANIDKPTQLFLVWMPDIDLVRRAGTRVEGQIGDRALRPQSLPALLHGHRVLFIRYVAKPVIAVLNPPMLQPLMADLSVAGSTQVDGMTLTADGAGSVLRISAGEVPHQVELDFLPGFPNLLAMGRAGTAAGKWSIGIAGVAITGGTWSARRQGERVALELDVTQAWKPHCLPLSMEILTRLRSQFRTWPRTYRWRGSVELGSAPSLSGAWERVGK
jgi:membrane protease YdiL (CAAX protease family)